MKKEETTDAGQQHTLAEKEEQQAMKEQMDSIDFRMGMEAGYNAAKYMPAKARQEIKSFGILRNYYQRGYVKGYKDWQHELSQERKRDLRKARERRNEQSRER